MSIRTYWQNYFCFRSEHKNQWSFRLFAIVWVICMCSINDSKFWALNWMGGLFFVPFRPGQDWSTWYLKKSLIQYALWEMVESWMGSYRQSSFDVKNIWNKNLYQKESSNITPVAFVSLVSLYILDNVVIRVAIRVKPKTTFFPL